MSSDNPILDMGLLNMWQPNQYLNPAYAGKSLQLPGFYTGDAGDMPPTDALGKPIQNFVNTNNQYQSDYQKALSAYNAQPAGGTPGTTLNSPPAQPQAQTSGTWTGQAQVCGRARNLLATTAIQELMANYQASPTGQAMANNPNAALIDYIQRQNQNMQAYPQGGSSGFGSGNSGPLSASQRDHDDQQRHAASAATSAGDCASPRLPRARLLRRPICGNSISMRFPTPAR